jgi:hypothetical protein
MRWLPAASGAISVLTILAITGRDYPLIGHDYRYFIPRLIDTDLHLRLNGPVVQWYTPSFGGGLPAFANPQHLQYSLVQALTLLVNPWIAVLTTIAIAGAVGYLCAYRLSRTGLGLGAAASVLGATFFTTSGFVIERAVVGHVGLQLFPLLPPMLWLLVDAGGTALSRGAMLGLIAAALLHQAGGISLVVMALSLALCLPLLVMLQPRLLNLARWIAVAAIALGFTAAMGGAKIIASLTLMARFPREFAELSPPAPAQALVSLVSQLTGVQTVSTLLTLVNLDPARVYGAMLHLGGDPWLGLWELDSGLSPVLFLCLLLGGWSTIAAWRRRELPAVSRVQRHAALILAIGVWIAVELSLGQGLLYPALNRPPLTSFLHVNERYVAACALPLSLTAAVLIDRWLTKRRRAAVALIVVSWLPPLVFLLLPGELHQRDFDVAPSLESYRVFREDPAGAAIDRIADVTDAPALSMRASSARLYEPLFGYNNETFKPETRIGDIRMLNGGYWNLTNPAGLLFPEVNGTRPFERIRESDRDKLDALAARRQPAWHVPAWMRFLNVLSAGSLIACVVVILAGLRRRPDHG